jgi:hypothetical protein
VRSDTYVMNEGLGRFDDFFFFFLIAFICNCVLKISYENFGLEIRATKPGRTESERILLKGICERR